MVNEKTDCLITNIIKENIQITEDIYILNLEIKKVTEEISEIDIEIYIYENTLNDLIRYETRNESDFFRIYNEYKIIANRNALLENKLNELIKKRLFLIKNKKILKQKLKMNKKHIHMLKKSNKSVNSIILPIELNGTENGEDKTVNQKMLIKTNKIKRNK